MASQNFDATGAPQDIVAGLSLAAGTTYTVQNLASYATLRVREASAAPEADARALKIEAGGYFSITPTAGEGIFLWTDEPTGCPVIVTEAA